VQPTVPTIESDNFNWAPTKKKFAAGCCTKSAEHQLIGCNGQILDNELSPLLGRKWYILTIRASVYNGCLQLYWLDQEDTGFFHSSSDSEVFDIYDLKE
jgi:hypothetical protein